MTRVSADWLALREGFDIEARNEHLTRQLVSFAVEQAEPLSVLDLGSGTGANFRYLAPRLPCDQSWMLVDVDPFLLQCVAGETQRWARTQGWTVEREGDATLFHKGRRCWTVVRHRLDLMHEVDRIDFRRFRLVTASALADLIGPAWFDDLARRCYDANAAVAVALTYNGRRVWAPRDPDDQVIVEWFNRHQQRDAGFGPAMGPQAGAYMARRFRNLGYRVLSGRSDWCIGPEHIAMHRALIEDAARPCYELVPQESGRIEAWAERRRRLVEEGACQLTVGHVDLLALP